SRARPPPEGARGPARAGRRRAPASGADDPRRLSGKRGQDPGCVAIVFADEFRATATIFRLPNFVAVASKNLLISTHYIYGSCPRRVARASAGDQRASV